MSHQFNRRTDSLIHQLKEAETVDFAAATMLPDTDDTELIEENRLSMVVRILNRVSISTANLVGDLPKILKLETQISGRVIGTDTVQFFFPSEELLEKTIESGPWFVNNWLLIGEKWSPNLHLQSILLWVSIKGLPVHKVRTDLVEAIGSKIGKVKLDSIQLHAKNSNSSLEYVRAQIWMPVDQPLIFKHPFCFPRGDPLVIEFSYDKLTKCCHECKRITHDQFRCPYKQTIQAGLSKTVAHEGTAEPKAKGRGRQVRAAPKVKESNVFDRLNSNTKTTTQQWRQKLPQEQATIVNEEHQQKLSSVAGSSQLRSPMSRISPLAAARLQLPNVETELSQDNDMEVTNPFVFQAARKKIKAKRKRRTSAELNARKRVRGAETQLAEAFNTDHVLSLFPGTQEPVTPLHNYSSRSQRLVVRQKPPSSI